MNLNLVDRHVAYFLILLSLDRHPCLQSIQSIDRTPTPLSMACNSKQIGW